MGSFVKVAKKQDILEGQGVVSDVNGTPVAIFNVGGNFYAIHNTCLHKGGPLGEGECDGTVVTCPWHGWQYDVTTGHCVDNSNLKVATFPVKVEGEDVLVEV